MTPAERQRKRRRLLREDKIEVRIEVSRAAREVLVDARWIGAWSEDDPEALREAAQRLFDGIKVDGAG